MKPATQHSASAPPVPERIINGEYIKLWLGLMFFMLNMSTFNLLPYYMELRGASPDLYGAVAGSMGVSNVIALLLLGHRADVWSRKTTVAFYFSAAFAGNLVAIWAMDQPSLNWYFVSRLLQGVFMGLGFPIIFSWAMESCPPQHKNLVLAWLGIGGIFSNSLGPTLGELIVASQPNPSDPASYYLVWLMATAFQVISLGIFLSVRNRGPAAEDGASRKGLLPLLQRAESRYLLAIGLSFGGLFGVIMSFGKNFTAEQGLAYVSVLLWAYSIGAILSRVFFRQITGRLSERHMIPLGLVGLGVTFLMLGQATTYPVLAATGLIYGFSHGILYPTLFAFFVNMQKPSELGRATTLFQGSFSIGWGLFPLLGGSLVRVTNFPTFFALLAAVSGAGVFAFLRADRLAWQRRQEA